MDTKISINENMSLGKRFFKYLAPSVVAMWVFSLYTMVDGIFVSKGVGELALAAVNISMPFINFIFAVSLLFSTGASTIIAIYLGKKDIKSANEVFSFNLVSIIILSIIILAITFFNLDRLALFLGATESTIGMVKDYLGIIIFFNGFFIVSYSLEVIIKTDGFPILATVGVIISALTNIILDYLFVIKFGWGVKGAGIATGLSQVFSTIFFLVHFLRKNSTLNFSKFRVDFKTLRKIVFIGFPDSTTELSCGIVVLLFNLSLTKYIGENALIYYSVINYINTLVLMTMMGITQGMQPLTSFYYGAGNIDNVKKLLKMGIKSTVIASIAVFAICMAFSGTIVSLFIHPEETILFNEGIRVFKIFSISFLLVGINVIISGFFVSVEKPSISTVISLGRGLVIVVLSLISMILIFGGKGIWMTTIVSEFICLILSIVFLKKNFSTLDSNLNKVA
ncbi:MATE family efflux transporter [Clostridioides sp. ES-S-0108-01]|uniref:MATE family efflux transporter n=1 Tax=Clostridioides sp. ES-S-0108-01 TaxID=2770773 RepID=UPI001D0C5A5F|nr:MATE family efflux transporter [Clostridioides sp. ES-S-0108-01]UDN52401.1 MATE family efflux transporter [Clostridioides sp. ES-S-0107-01]